jgi:hypothetical protein
MKKFKKLSIIVFDPSYAKKEPNAYTKHPLKIGELVVYIGEIPNAPGHCCVLKHSGEAVWLVHSTDFRLATKEEV